MTSPSADISVRFDSLSLNGGGGTSSSRYRRGDDDSRYPFIPPQSNNTALIGGREVPIRPMADDRTGYQASPEERARRERELSDKIREEDARFARSRGTVDSSVPDSAYRRPVPGSFSERLRMEEGTTEEQLRGRRLERFQPPRDNYRLESVHQPNSNSTLARRRSIQSPSSGAFAPASSMGSSLSNPSSRAPNTPPHPVTRGFAIPSSPPPLGSSSGHGGDKFSAGDYSSSLNARRMSFSVRSPSPSRIERPPSPNSGYVGRDGKWVQFTDSERKASLALSYRMRALYGDPASSSS